MLHAVHFDTWGDFVRTADTGYVDLAGGPRSSQKYSSGWSGETFPEAVRLATYGWPEGAAAMEQAMRITQNLLPARMQRTEIQMSVVGPGVLDMGRYIMGHPESWMVQTQVDTDLVAHGGTVRILFNVAASAGVEVDEMFRRGSAVCVLVDTLERMGRRVELTIAMAVQRNGGNAEVTALVKQAEDPLDIDRIAFATANAAVFRRLGFSLFEQAPVHIRRTVGLYTGGMYGYVYSINREGYVNLDGADLREGTAYQLIHWLKQQLADQGIDWDMNG